MEIAVNRIIITVRCHPDDVAQFQREVCKPQGMPLQKNEDILGANVFTFEGDPATCFEIIRQAGIRKLRIGFY